MAKRMSKKAANEAAIAAAEKEAPSVKVFDADELFDPDEGSAATATAVAEQGPGPEEEHELDDDENDDLDDESDDENDLEDEANDDGTNDADEEDVADHADTDTAPATSPVDATPETEHSLLKRIGECARECKEAESYVAECKAELKEAKGYYEKLAARLSNLCLALENDKDRPLLAKMEASPPLPVDGGEAVAAEAATDAPLAVEPEDESWKDFEVCNLDIPDGVVKSLHEAEIETMGELAEFTAVKKLTDIDGIGPGKAAKIEEATMKFWAERNAAKNVAEPKEET